MQKLPASLSATRIYTQSAQNGPDFLFFSHAKPWEAYKSHELNRLGSKLHAGYVNAFYTEAIRSIRRQTITEVRKDMMAYLFGHLCHWALDMVVILMCFIVRERIPAITIVLNL